MTEAIKNSDGSVTFQVYIHASKQNPLDNYFIQGFDATWLGEVLLSVVDLTWTPPVPEVVIPKVVESLQKKITEVRAEAESEANLLNEQIQKLLSIGYTDNTSS